MQVLGDFSSDAAATQQPLPLALGGEKLPDAPAARMLSGAAGVAGDPRAACEVAVGRMQS